MTRVVRAIVVAMVLGAAIAVPAAGPTVIEDWSMQRAGERGVPGGWQKQDWGSPAYDFTVVEDGGRKVLHLRSRDDSSTISKDIRNRVNLRETPILEWTWKAITLPPAGNARKGATDDEAAQLYVVWERFPSTVRSQIIGYIWDTTDPVGASFRSEKTGTVIYVVVRSGTADLGRWITERRNVVEDFKWLYRREPPAPTAISITINSQNTKSSAESLIGAIRFVAP